MGNIEYKNKTKKAPGISPGGFIKGGGYLLSHLMCSTIGAIGLNFSVRNGKRWIPNATATLNMLRVRSEKMKN